MKQAMHPVLHQIGQEHDLEDLQHDRLTANDRLHVGKHRPVKQHECRLQRQVGRDLDEHRADEEVGEVEGPALAENAPLFASTEQFLQRDHDQRINDEQEQRVVEAEVVIAAEILVERNA